MSDQSLITFVLPYFGVMHAGNDESVNGYFLHFITVVFLMDVDTLTWLFCMSYIKARDPPSPWLWRSGCTAQMLAHNYCNKNTRVPPQSSTLFFDSNVTNRTLLSRDVSAAVAETANIVDDVMDDIFDEDSNHNDDDRHSRISELTDDVQPRVWSRFKFCEESHGGGGGHLRDRDVYDAVPVMSQHATSFPSRIRVRTYVICCYY